MLFGVIAFAFGGYTSVADIIKGFIPSHKLHNSTIHKNYSDLHQTEITSLILNWSAFDYGQGLLLNFASSIKQIKAY